MQIKEINDETVMLNEVKKYFDLKMKDGYKKINKLVLDSDSYGNRTVRFNIGGIIFSEIEFSINKNKEIIAEIIEHYISDEYDDFGNVIGEVENSHIQDIDITISEDLHDNECIVEYYSYSEKKWHSIKI